MKDESSSADKLNTNCSGEDWDDEGERSSMENILKAVVSRELEDDLGTPDNANVEMELLPGGGKSSVAGGGRRKKDKLGLSDVESYRNQDPYSVASSITPSLQSERMKDGKITFGEDTTNEIQFVSHSEVGMPNRPATPPRKCHSSISHAVPSSPAISHTNTDAPSVSTTITSRSHYRRHGHGRHGHGGLRIVKTGADLYKRAKDSEENYQVSRGRYQLCEWDG